MSALDNSVSRLDCARALEADMFFVGITAVVYILRCLYWYFVLQTSKYRVTGRAVEIECKKVGRGQIWPRLAEKTGKLSWLKTDFDHLAFEDSDGSSEDDLTVCAILCLSLLFI